MANYSVHVGTVKRSIGQNAIASAAYNSRSKLSLIVTDKETNISSELEWNYNKKGGLAYSKIDAPEHAPEWVFDRQQLWNKAEQAENRCNAITAGKIMIALPKEFSDEQNIELITEITRELVALGMVVDSNMHTDNKGNPHVHIMHTTREFVENRYGEMEFSGIKNRDWQGPNWVKRIRELAANKINKHYEMHGFDCRVSHKSYKDLGVDIEPGRHEGPARNIGNAELVELNRQIAKENAEKIKAKPSIILDIVGMNHPVFTKEQIATELERRLHAGIDFSKIEDIESMQSELSATFTRLYEQILNCPEISQVVEADFKSRTLYTTTKRLELEERFTSNIYAMHNSNGHSLGIQDTDLDHLSLTEKLSLKARDVTAKIVDNVNDKTNLNLAKPKQAIFLSEEQRRAVINILNGSDISVLEGIPGAGKTTAMREIVRQYKKAGRKVIGVAPSSSASLELAKATGIECKNASLWRKEWTEAQGREFELVIRGDYYKEDLYRNNTPSLTNKHVMIIDEASMGELANMDYLISEAKSVGAKVLLVGDNNQLSPVGWAGALGKIISICGSERLEESRRQQNPLHQEATKLLSQYRVRDALDIYLKGDNIKIAENESESGSKAVRSFVDSYIESAKSIEKDDLVALRSKAIGVFANKTRERLNEQVRDQLKEAGILKGQEHRVLVGSVNRDGKYEKYYLNLKRGEQIVFSRNVNRLGNNGVFNGELATILKIHTPDSEGLAVIDMLVHKANGSKEKVSLNLKELATNPISSRYFHDGISIDYGYAVTAHKVQGASIDDFVVQLEKGVGYEVFNVLATRHKYDLQIFTDKETLSDAFYESLDKTATDARNRFDLAKSDESEIIRGGLAKIISKRTNTSFASDYRTMGQTKEDKIIKSYLDCSEETIATMRKITSWQGQYLRKNGNKPQMWENKELWQQFKEVREYRSIAAKAITSDYSVYKNRLQQLNMNYATIEKHASQLSRVDKLDKVIVNQKHTIFHEQNNFKELVQSVSSGQTRAVRNSYKEVNLHIADTFAAIEEYREAILSYENHRQELADNIEKEEHYRKILMPEYLNRIYHTYAGTKQDAGTEALELYARLVDKHGADKAIKMVKKDPGILGGLKGYGIGRLFGINNARKDAIALFQNVEKQLDAYNRSGKMLEAYKKEMQEVDFGAKICAISEEIEHLRSLLPADIDKEFLDIVGDKLNTSSSNNVNWKSLQNSELFESVYVNQFKERQSADIINIGNGINGSVNRLSTIGSSDELPQEQQVENSAAVQSNKVQNSKPHDSKPRLTFEEVKIALNPSIASEIFRHYAPLINSDGKVEKKADRITAGSLNMSLGGSKLGLWKRFSDGSKGDIFSFVEKATGCSKVESLEIVASHVGIVATDKHINTQPLQYNKLKEHYRQNDEYTKISADFWVAKDIVPDKAPRFMPAKDLAFLRNNNSKVTNRYEYRNKDDQLIGYAVRIEENGTGKKQVLPVAYCYNKAKNKSKWCLKGFSDNGSKPIYGLEKLTQHPDKTILIVEGEKTADAAQKLFPAYNVISWMGGAQAVDKVNWSNLTEREVVIWPDNDKPGMDAAHKIMEHIDNHNGFSGIVSVVDTKNLELPEKWDLADDLPGKATHINLESVIANTFGNNIGAGDKLKVSHEWLSDNVNRKVFVSLDMLVATGRICNDEYISKALYQDTILAIAKSKGLDLINNKVGSNFANNIRSLQEEYQNLHKEYERNDYIEKGKDGIMATSNPTTQEQIVSECVRNISVLHQLCLGISELTSTHKEHIKQTVQSEVSKMQRFAESDKEHTADNIYRIVSSNKWLKELDSKNTEKTTAITTRFAERKEEVQYVNTTLASITKQKKLSKTPEEAIAILKKEQDFLVGLHGTFKYPDSHSDNLKLSIVNAKESKEKHVFHMLEKEVEINRIQGIRTDKELTRILVKPEGNIAELSKHLSDLAKNNRNNSLSLVKIQLNSLSKLGYKVDQDKLVSILKEMTYEEKDKYMDKLVATQLKSYAMPLLAVHKQEKAEANNVKEWMQIIGKEQGTYLELHTNHEMALHSLQEGDDVKLAALVESAKKLDAIGGIKKLRSVIDQTIANNIKTETEILKELKDKESCMHRLCRNLQKMCENHHIRTINDNLKRLDDNIEIKVNNSKFRDPISYLNHLKNYHSHECMPSYHIDKSLQEIKQRQTQETQKQHEMYKNKEMDGPSL